MRKRKRSKSVPKQPEAEPPSPPAWKTDLLWLALAGVVAFASSVPGNFVWLDHAEIEKANYRVVDADDWSRLWTQTIEQYQGRRSGVVSESGGYWRPIYALSISLDWLLWNGRPWCYHLENILWHLAVVFGLYVLGNQVFGSTPDGRRAVFWATLLFAVHPLGVHSVTWISGRKDTMCAAFGIAALVALGQAAGREESTEANWGQTLRWFALSALCLLLSIGSKELGFVVPVMATVLFFPPLIVRDDANRKQRTVRLVGLSVLWACALAMASYRVRGVGAIGLDAPYPSHSLLNNFAMSANLAWHYVWRILVPYEVTLSDAWPVVQSVGLGDVLAMLGLVVVAGVAVYGWFRNWPIALALLWFAIWMLPTCGIMPLRHFRAERYLYPASWGILLAAMMLFLPALSKAFASHGQRATAIVMGVIVAWFTVRTVQENTFWWNDDALFGHSVAQDRRHVEGHIELSRLALEREDYRETVRLARQALDELQDDTFVAYGVPFYAHTWLGTGLVHLGQPEEGLREFQQALLYMPNSPTGYLNLAMAEVALGDLQSAKVHLAQCLEFDPNDEDARHNLCLALLHLEEYEEAEEHLQLLLQAKPDHVERRALLAYCQWKMGKHEEARRTLEDARRLAPNDAAVRRVDELIRREAGNSGGR